MRHAIWFLGAVMIAATACHVTTALRDCASFVAPSPDIVCVTGTVRYVTIEGGFWAVGGDDGTTYDPLGGLPGPFQHQGLRVRLEARIRPDMAGFHMVGPIVQILKIQAL